ncbi:hypothetical protein BH18CHL2_BH18CHL2_00990 [soil metagenome]
MAWKTAGYYGLDRILLPLRGTPWQPIPSRRTAQDKPLAHTAQPTTS